MCAKIGMCTALCSDADAPEAVTPGEGQGAHADCRRWARPLLRMRDTSLATDGFSATLSTFTISFLRPRRMQPGAACSSHAHRSMHSSAAQQAIDTAC